MHLFTHHTESWRKFPNLINGAITYSEDIVKHQLIHWGEILGPDDLLSTAPPPNTCQLPSNIDTAIIYLHSWPVEADIDQFRERYTSHAKQTIYISAYKPYTEYLKANGFQCVWIPMSIDAEEVRKFHRPKDKGDRIIYYGNVSNVKRPLLREIRSTCKSLGMEFDAISYNKLNGQTIINREDSLRLISTYKFGIGVGRCFLELQALNVKSFIAGRHIGGLVMNNEDYIKQQEVNANGRIYTYSNDIKKCLLNVNKSIIYVPEMQNHVEEVLKCYDWR